MSAWFDTGPVAPSCLGMPTDWWFPRDWHERGQADPRLNGALALRVCRVCPLKARCLAHALDHNEMGIWGGTTDADRLRMTGHMRKDRPQISAA